MSPFFTHYLYAHPLASISLHLWQLKGVLSTSLEFFESKPVGEIINRFNSDLNMIDLTLPNHAVNFMYVATKIIGSSIIIIVAGPYLRGRAWRHRSGPSSRSRGFTFEADGNCVGWISLLGRPSTRCFPRRSTQTVCAPFAR